MTKKLTGTVRGNTIELDGSTGLADGERVRIELETERASGWGEGIRRSAGSLAQDNEFGRAMEEIQRSRQTDLRPAAEL